MKKKSFFKKTLGLGLASVLGVTSIFSLASCKGVPTEKVETENLSMQTSIQALADTTTTWKSLNSIPSEWVNVSEGITIPAGTILRLNGVTDCLTGANCDDTGYINSWIIEQFNNDYEEFLKVSNEGDVDQEYVYSIDDGNIRFVLRFNGQARTACGDFWFGDDMIGFTYLDVYFLDVRVCSINMETTCPCICDCGVVEKIDTETTVTLNNDLYIKSYDDCSNCLEYFIFGHVFTDSFEYSIPGTIEAGTKIKFNPSGNFYANTNDEMVSFLKPIFNNVASSGSAFINNFDSIYSSLGITEGNYTVTQSPSEDSVLITIPILETGNEDTSIVFRLKLIYEDPTGKIYQCCPIWDDGVYIAQWEILMGDAVMASLNTTGDSGCIESCTDYPVIYTDDEYVLASDYVTKRNDVSTLTGFFTEFCFEDSFSYLIDLQAPSLEGSNTFTVNVDSLLTQDEILSHVVATDDTDSAPEIVVESSTYTAAKQIGTFYIYVHAVDDAGNVSPTYTLTINVKDSTSPVMKAITKSVGNNVVLSQDELLALFTATDNYYSASNITIELITDSYTSKSRVPGTYEVIAKATDPSGNYSTKSTNITVTDATAPTISATNITTGNNAKLSDAELKALFTYNDDVTGTSALKFEYTSDNYSANYNKLGTYQITAKVTDEAGNYSTDTANITVEDKTAPTISATNKTTVYNTLLSEDELKALFTYSDDVSTTDNITLTITANTYTASYNKLGVYQVTAKVVDENNNEASDTANITVVDNVKPIITGADINITNATILTEEQIRNYYKVNDAYDGELQFTLTWVKNYLETPSKVGVYSFTISASDLSNNPISQTFNLNVTDGIVPELWLDNYFIVVDTNTEVTQELLVAYAAASLCVAEADIVSVDGSFDNSEAGIYILSAKLADGTAKPIKLSIVEGAEIPTEESKYDFNIKDIFKGEFWANYASGWTNNFAWPHWTTIGLAVLMLAALVIVIRKRK